MKKSKKNLDLLLIWKTRCKLFAEAHKLIAEGDKLNAEADLLWINAVIEKYGKKIKLEWKNWHEDKKSYECHLETGEVFVP